jgi:hypothetical protein
MFEQVRMRETTTRRLTCRLNRMVRPALEADAGPYQKRGYFVRPGRDAFDLEAAAVQVVLTTILGAGFVIVAALIAIDVLDIH